MDELVHLNEEHQILICQLCQAGVRPGVGIERHFRKEHELKGQVLQDIKDYFGTIELNDPVTHCTDTNRWNRRHREAQNHQRL